MFAGHEEHLLLTRAFQNLVHGVELGSLSQVAQIAGVNDEVGRDGKSVDLLDGCLQRAVHIRICRLVESNVAALLQMQKGLAKTGCSARRDPAWPNACNSARSIWAARSLARQNR